jgi:hypothetical protein
MLKQRWKNLHQNKFEAVGSFTSGVRLTTHHSRQVIMSKEERT